MSHDQALYRMPHDDLGRRTYRLRHDRAPTGVQEYYDTLDALDAPTRISGRVTAELEMALPGKFEAKTAEALGKEPFPRPPTPRLRDRR